MVAEPIQLSVPSVDILDRDAAVALFGRGEQGEFVAVGQGFGGIVSGRALLIFPEAKSFELVRALVGQHGSLDDIADLEHEALSEVGNVVLNGFLGTIANLLGHPLPTSLPCIERGTGQMLLQSATEQVDRATCSSCRSTSPSAAATSAATSPSC